jgi:hypothetical protein
MMNNMNMANFRLAVLQSLVFEANINKVKRARIREKRSAIRLNVFDDLYLGF